MNLTHLNSAHLVENFILYGLLLKKKKCYMVVRTGRPDRSSWKWNTFFHSTLLCIPFKTLANGATLFGCYMLCLFANHVARCCAKLRSNFWANVQLPTHFLFRDRRSVAQQCWIRCTARPTLLGPHTRILHIFGNTDAICLRVALDEIK